MKNLLTSVLAIAATNPSGFTVSLSDLSTPAAGYAVAAAETQNSFGPSGLADVLILAPALGAQFVGGWLDEETGKFYFDATFVVDDLETAKELGRRNGQLAIFDLANGEEIRL